MNLHKFITEYFDSWRIASILTCGTEHGVIKLRSGNTFIRVFFQMHGDKHWTGPNVMVDHVESLDEFLLN